MELPGIDITAARSKVYPEHVTGRFRNLRNFFSFGLTSSALSGSLAAVERQAGRPGRPAWAQVPYRKVYVHPNDHAGYYPGAEAMTLKLLFAPDKGRILGAQAIGRKGVDKRIDVLAMALQAGLTVFDLEQAELCYAPAYGSAKDPVNLAGFVASNWMRGDHPQVSVEELDGSEKQLDVRTKAEHNRGHIPGSLHIPVDELRGRWGKFLGMGHWSFIAKVGLRGYTALRILQQRGYSVRNVSGGYRNYELFGKPAVNQA